MKKNFRIVLALVLALSMVLGMVPAMAAVPTDGSITVKSPVVSATYNVYKVFEMSTNDGVTAFSYTIDTNNPFYTDIATWAATPANGLVLSEIISEAVADDPATEDTNEYYKKFNVQASTAEKPIKLNDSTNYGNFDPQAFGQMLLTAMTRDANPVTATAAKPAITVGVADSAQIKFDNLALGYYLINATYPSYAIKTPKLGADGDANQQTFEKADFVVDDNTDKASALSAAGAAKVTAYVNATVTNEYVNKYLTDKAISTNKDGTPLTDAGKAEYMADLKASMTTDATQKVIDAYNDDSTDADINVKKPVLVFLDSSQPDAVINEKNEINKWDVPVNPSATTAPGTPDHGEPEGGKNIVVQEATDDTPAYYADWTEAKIGDSVHYQLRVNAMNFINTSTSTTLDQENADKVVQVKEYFLADYESAQMHYDTTKGLKVSIWAGDNNNDTTAEASTGTDKPTNVTKNVTYGQNGAVTIENATELDYSNQYTNFFMNTSGTSDGNMATLSAQPNGIFDDKAGIMVPWTFVEKATVTYGADGSETIRDPRADYKVYTITKVPNGEYVTEEIAKEDDGTTLKTNKNPNGSAIPGQYVGVGNHVVNAQGQVLDEDNNPIQKNDVYYVYSLYNSDVTIVVDYYMILDDDAIVDDPGNKNFAQFAWNPVDNKDDENKPKAPTNPGPNDKPSEFEEIDDATVYTCAIAWVKTDNKANPLAGAEFELPFYVKTAKDNNTYVYGLSNEDYAKLTAEAEKAQYKNKVTTDDTGVITIKGITSTKNAQDTQYKITETKAPDGYNQLTEPFYLQAKRSDVGVHTTTKTKIYKDAQGNITSTETQTFVEFVTDEDSFNNETTADPEEKSVPVYEFHNIINNKGAELPSTGGMGTTIFYMAGSLMVLAAAILLITKRRMGAED